MNSSVTPASNTTTVLPKLRSSLFGRTNNAVDASTSLPKSNATSAFINLTQHTRNGILTRERQQSYQLLSTSRKFGDQQLAEYAISNSQKVLRQLALQLRSRATDTDSLQRLQSKLAQVRSLQSYSGQPLLDSKLSLNLPSAGVVQHYQFQISGMNASGVSQKSRHLFQLGKQKSQSQLITIEAHSSPKRVATQLNLQLAAMGIQVRHSRGELIFKTSGHQLDNLKHNLSIVGKSELFSQNSVQINSAEPDSLENMPLEQLQNTKHVQLSLAMAGKRLAIAHKQVQQLKQVMSSQLSKQKPLSLSGLTLFPVTGSSSTKSVLAQCNFSRSQLSVLLGR